MKNLVKVAFVFAMAVIVLAACSKDQKCVNWLEGQWTISKIEVTDSNGVTVNVFEESQGLISVIELILHVDVFCTDLTENACNLFRISDHFLKSNTS
jgi:hypothetical protein